jgi:hypothetical protein
MNNELIDKLKAIALSESWVQDSENCFTIEDATNGDTDEAYTIGYNDGRISLAREILSASNINWRT